MAPLARSYPIRLRDTLSPAPLLSSIQKRQTSIVAIPTTYGNLDSGPAPGTVVGIVFGSVAGFLLILWLLYTCFGGGGFYSGGDNVSSVVIRERVRKSRSSRSRRSRSVRESVRAPAPPPPMVERVIIEERRERPRAASVARSEVDDEVVVIEEHSPPPRRNGSRRKERDSGYRTVDPMSYGGGDRPLREVRRGSGRR